MDYHRVKELVELFWNGKTSDQEEQELKAYFSSNKSPEEFKETANYFRFASFEQSNNGLDLNFDQRVLKTIKPRKNNARLFLRIAAGFALLFAMFFFMQSLDGPDNPEIVKVEESIEDTYNDPQQAYDEVKRALMMVSGKMNKSKQYGKELKKFNHAKKEIRLNKEN